ncbi:MAG: 50S ribosomal protein L22 [Candidatus Liptonbacteria bacterium]|nr:50S ribosomal protein L22 [Candidatus Liptonbacteria bacterium]
MKEQSAQLKYLHMAPRKVRAVADLIRGLSVNEAEAELRYARRRGAKPLLKLLRSAVANAKQNQRLLPEKLVVSRIEVGQGPMLKRMLRRARGMADPIQKKMSHVRIILAERSQLPSPRFTILVAKKVKTPEGERPKRRKGAPKKEAVSREETVPVQQAGRGLFRRIFRRKTGV